MTEPSEAALRKACEVLDCNFELYRTSKMAGITRELITRLARHLDAEDKAAREAAGTNYQLYGREERLDAFARRHILPDPKPTVRDILQRARRDNLNHDETAEALRDAGLLKETDDVAVQS